jgi:UDP-2,3-diacylglucosamine hydrolase
MTKPFLIVSDTHLGAVPDETERRFRAFLDHAGSDASGLLINGDLFDFWFEYRSVVPRRHYRVVAALRDVIEGGIPIWFVAGNHDAWGGSFLRDEVGLTLLEGPVEMELMGRRALIAHGDGVGTGDLRYRALKRFIRHPVTVGAFRALHPDLGARIAERVSSTDQKKADAPDSRSRADFIRDWGTEQLRRRPELDMVLAGHAHIPEVLEVEDGRHFVNSGDWIHHYSYISIPDVVGPPELLYWP